MNWSYWGLIIIFLNFQITQTLKQFNDKIHVDKSPVIVQFKPFIWLRNIKPQILVTFFPYFLLLPNSSQIKP
jgi:hypothetical protein